MAMRGFERTGDAHAPARRLPPDLSFRLADRVERSGRDEYAGRIARDLEDGVTVRVREVVLGADVAVVELWLDSPPDHPLHCPPAATQVHLHDGEATRRIVTHYATLPGLV